MGDKKQIRFGNVLAGMFLFLLVIPVSLKSIHYYEHQDHPVNIGLLTISAECPVCEATYLHAVALPVSFSEPFAPHFFELSLLLSYTASTPELTFISYDPGRGPPVGFSMLHS